MANGQRRVRPEFWIGLICAALLVYALIAGWWKGHAALGWVILGIVVAVFAFSLYRFPGFRGWLFGVAKKAGKSIVYETEASGREPMPKYTRMNTLQRAKDRCENPDCRSDVPPHIHHIDNASSNNNLRNLVALCPNCHAKAHRNEYSNSQLRNWVQRSWETFKRGRRRFQY